MDRVQYPSADFALLLYLACVTAMLGLFAWSFYGLMQPTTVPNPGLANYKEPRLITVFLHKVDTSTSMEQMERTAIAAAREDNKEQGIEPLRAFAAAEPALANTSAPRAQSAVVQTQAAEAYEAEARRATRGRSRSLALVGIRVAVERPGQDSMAGAGAISGRGAAIDNAYSASTLDRFV